MRTWIRFFVGTPKRFLGTFIAIALVVVMVKPELLRQAIDGLLTELSPLVGTVVMFAILWFGLKKIFGIK